MNRVVLVRGGRRSCPLLKFSINFPIALLPLSFRCGHLRLSQERFGPSRRGDVIGAGIQKRRGLSLLGWHTQPTFMRESPLAGVADELLGSVSSQVQPFSSIMFM